MKVQAAVAIPKSLQKTLRSLKEGEGILEEMLNLAAIRIEGNAKRNIQQVSSGKRETRYDIRKREVIVSKPGDSPNTDTGTAIKSVRHWIKSKVVFVGTRLKYLAMLEFDSVSTKRKARPWLKPAVKKFLEDNPAFFSKGMKKDLKKKRGRK